VITTEPPLLTGRAGRAERGVLVTRRASPLCAESDSDHCNNLTLRNTPRKYLRETPLLTGSCEHTFEHQRHSSTSIDTKLIGCPRTQKVECSSELQGMEYWSRDVCSPGRVVAKVAKGNASPSDHVVTYHEGSASPSDHVATYPEGRAVSLRPCCDIPRGQRVSLRPCCNMP
jgi:hypothetical protein